MKRVSIVILVIALVGLVFLRRSKPQINDKRQMKNAEILRALSPAPTEGMTPQQLELFKKYHLDQIHLPKGFRISVFAEVPTARSLAVSPGGVVYVGNREENSVIAVADQNHDGFAETQYTIASGLHVPNGVALKNGDLYIATINSIYKIPGVERNLTNPPAPQLIYRGYPSDEPHGWKFIAFGPDGNLYVPVGIPCNDCVSGNPIYGTITRFNPDTKKVDIIANGVRNTVGFDWKPDTHQLWFTDNARDNMGDNVPKDELDMISKDGENFGAPYCWEDGIRDPENGTKDCSQFAKPVLNLGPHVAALGMRFYTGSMFPSEYKNRIFIAEHGSWNRSTAIGYRVTVVKLDGNSAASYEPFAEGWLPGTDQYQAYGRPVDVAVYTDGSLLVSDDKAGAIYRITYSK